MDDKRLWTLYRLVMELSPPLSRRCQCSSNCLPEHHLWPVVRGNSMKWACDPRNAPAAPIDPGDCFYSATN